MTETKSAKKSSNVTLVQTIGRRKTSTARIAMKDGTGVLKINGQDATEYLQRPTLHMIIMEPLELLQCTAKYDFKIRVNGGGKAGQAGAIRLGISRALAGLDEKCHKELRDGTFLTRDSRMKERKKYGQPGARKRFQFSKR
ncbi:MAG: small subunit ribosomal protein S9 [Candidatus Omnitrophota bacterium]|jgi:small subunit ribosomal protein S9